MGSWTSAELKEQYDIIMEKNFILWSSCVLVTVFAVIWLAFPPPPDTWCKLKYQMHKDEIYKLVITPNVNEETKIVREDVFYTQIWRRQHLFGYWEIKVYYEDNLSLFSAYVRYKSYLFPFIKRRRNYS